MVCILKNKNTTALFLILYHLFLILYNLFLDLIIWDYYCVEIKFSRHNPVGSYLPNKMHGPYSVNGIMGIQILESGFGIWWCKTELIMKKKDFVVVVVVEHVDY